MANSLTWASFHKLEARKERKEKLYSKLRFAVIVAIWFSFGVIVGRAIESFVLGNLLLKVVAN